MHLLDSETKICVNIDVSGAETKIWSQDTGMDIDALGIDHEGIYFINVNGTFTWTT